MEKESDRECRKIVENLTFKKMVTRAFKCVAFKAKPRKKYEPLAI
jgi:hypothetical protein